MGDIQRAPWMHIVGQFRWHDEAIITGSASALNALRDAITVALETGSGSVDVFASDGEGYSVRVRRTRTMSGLGQPVYYEEVAQQLMKHEREITERLVKDQRRRPA